jgi:hypothetical protein
VGFERTVSPGNQELTQNTFAPLAWAALLAPVVVGHSTARFSWHVFGTATARIVTLNETIPLMDWLLQEGWKLPAMTLVAGGGESP